MGMGLNKKEDKKMKTFKTTIKTLAALLMAAAATTACTSDDNATAEPTPVTADAPKTYTMTVEATKATGDAAQTRGLYYGTDGALNAKWNANELVYVFQYQTSTNAWAFAGILKSAASDNDQTTLTGKINLISGGDNSFRFVLHIKDEAEYTGQKGLLLKSQGSNSIEDKYDFATCDVSGDKVTLDTESGTATITGGISLQSAQAIVKFTLVDEEGNPISAKTLTIEENTGASGGSICQKYDFTTSNHTCGALTIEPASPSNTIYAAIKDVNTSGNSEYTLTATTDDGKSYTYTKSGVTFTAGKYYEVNVKMAVKWNDTAVDVSAQSYTAKFGDVLTGTTEDNAIFIADGAIVKLKDLHINGRDYAFYHFAGLTLEGDATIVLEGTNYVRGFYEGYAGIHVAEGHTLTIQGTGSLTVTSHGNRCAGIGGNAGQDCGNIVIKGGTIDVSGTCKIKDEFGGAGIGSSYEQKCGDITITGGTVTATAGGYLAAAIGSAWEGTCGNITITDGVTKVTATKNSTATSIAPWSIGNGQSGQCGTVTIGGVEGMINESPYTYQPSH